MIWLTVKPVMLCGWLQVIAVLEQVNVVTNRQLAAEQRPLSRVLEVEPPSQ
jgi:hypothetical protein